MRPVCPSLPACAVLAPFDLTAGGTPLLLHGYTDIKESAALRGGYRSPKAIGLSILGFAGFLSWFREPHRNRSLGSASPITSSRPIPFSRFLRSHSGNALQRKPDSCKHGLPDAPHSGSERVAIRHALRSCTTRSRLAQRISCRPQQAFGKYFVLDGEYIWKYTHDAYDFNDFGNTPIFFPIEWNNSKIPGFSVRASVPNFHRLTAFVVLSSVAARFFNPQVAGLGSGLASTGVFRIDHDEKLAQTTTSNINLSLAARGSDSTGDMTADS